MKRTNEIPIHTQTINCINNSEAEMLTSLFLDGEIGFGQLPYLTQIELLEDQQNYDRRFDWSDPCCHRAR